MGADLQGFLDLAGDVVVFLPNDAGVQHAGGGVEGIDSRVDAQLSNAARQHSRCVQVGKSRSRCWICQIICWHIDGLQVSSD